MLPTPTPDILDALRLLGIGRRRIGELVQWALDNPRKAALGADALGVFAEHRVNVLQAKLKQRRWKGRLPVRIARMESAVLALGKLADMCNAYAEEKEAEERARADNRVDG